MSKKESDIKCVKHGATIRPNNFYLAGDRSVFSGLGRIPICKNCLYKMVNEYYEESNDMELAIYYTLRKMDLGYNSGFFKGAYESGNSAEDTLKQYMRQMNSIGSVNNSQFPFDLGEHLELERHMSQKIEDGMARPDTLNEDEKRNKEEVIRILQYDPFEGYPEIDQRELYSDLIEYLNDEDVVEDQYKVSQIIQIVINNNQINKLDRVINSHMATTDKMLQMEGEVKKLNDIKKEIVKNNNTIAKDNKISGGSGSSGQSSLTTLMKRVEELGFERIKEDYYDQITSDSMKRIAEISMDAMYNQMKFDENDIREIISEQRATIKSLEQKVEDLEKEIQLLNKEITELEGGNIE